MSALAGPTFAAHLDARRARIDAALAEALPDPPACPPCLFDALRYSLEAGGKRMRPVLTLLCAEAIDSRTAVVALAEPAACAIEIIHTYSLIHDDLPAMDNDTLRRGRPTAHVVFGEGLAILAGDGLLTEAFGLLARRPDTSSEDIARRKLQTLALIAGAAGAAGMVGGQAVDLDAAGQVRHPPGHPPGPLDAAALADMHARKTGALIRAAAMAGAIMAGGRPAQVEAIGEYGTHLGLAFQIVDDILDVEGDPANLGKSPGKDAAAGKPTYPALFGMVASRHLAAEAAAKAAAAITGAALRDPEPLRALAAWIVSRTH